MASGRLRIGQVGPGQYSLNAEVGTYALTGQAAQFQYDTGEEPEGLLFTDEFATDRTHTQNGISWTSSGSVTRVADAGNSTGFALRFRYGPDANCTDSSAEQRFDLGTFHTDLWFKYRIFIPLNYFHRDQNSCASASQTNNKWLRVWYGENDGNSGYTSYFIKGGFSTRAQGTGGDSELICEYGRVAQEANPNSVGRYHTNLATDWITDEDLGQEVEFIMHIRADTEGAYATSIDYEDGARGNAAFQVWKNGTRLINHTDVNWTHTLGLDVQRFRHGYVLGWANSGFEEITDVLVREVTIANANIFGVT